MGCISYSYVLLDSGAVGPRGLLSQKLVSNFLYFGMNLPKDGTNQLPKAGFDFSKGPISRSESSKFVPFSTILTHIVHLFKIYLFSN